MIPVAITIAVSVTLAIVASTVAVPPVIVSVVAACATPMALEELATFVTWAEPCSASIRRPSPIPLVPAIVVAYRVPITLYPHKPWPRRHRSIVEHMRGRGRADPNTNRETLRKD